VGTGRGRARREPGAYSSGVTLGAAGAIQDDPDTAASFDGLSGEALLPGPALSVDGTLEGWFDWRAGTAVLRDHSAAGGWLLAFDSGGAVSCRAAGRTFSTGIDAATKIRGGWHHLVLTKAGPNLAFYLDGAYVAGIGGAGNAASLAPWHVMNNGLFAEQYAQGRADEVAIYNRALTPAEIASHYRLGRDDA
jgi:concanavalin A-like lectin/glucanase superfamily protein